MIAPEFGCDGCGVITPHSDNTKQCGCGCLLCAHCKQCADCAAKPARKRGRPSTGIPVLVRIPADVLKTLDDVARLRHLSRAQVIRELLTAWDEQTL